MRNRTRSIAVSQGEQRRCLGLRKNSEHTTGITACCPLAPQNSELAARGDDGAATPTGKTEGLRVDGQRAATMWLRNTSSGWHASDTEGIRSCWGLAVLGEGRVGEGSWLWGGEWRSSTTTQGEERCCCSAQLAAQVGGGAHCATRERGSSSDVRQQCKGEARCWNFWAPWTGSWAAMEEWGSAMGDGELAAAAVLRGKEEQGRALASCC
jgi:hypothetical protein